MTDVQQRAIAAGFLHALQTTPELVAEWIATPKDNYAAIGQLIQRATGVAQAPSSADIQAMAQHIDAHLQEHVQAIRSENPEAPAHVGLVALMQQN